jgi:alpha-D-glucose phosphate-specific phosphoglucomutase
MIEIKFGTDGWRGIIADTFTFDNLRLVSQAISAYLIQQNGNKGLFIGYDARFLGYEFAAQCEQIMLGSGINTICNNRPTPTPIVAHAVRSLDLDGAVMLTASHNPPIYQGIKFIPSYAGPANLRITQEIERLIKEISKKQSKAGNNPTKLKSKFLNPVNHYFKHLHQIIDAEAIEKSNLLVAVDPMHGAAVKILTKVVEEFGARVACLNDNFDPLFGGKNPDPSKDTLEELSALVRKKQAALGISVDGDGDRFGIVDDNGCYLNANQVLGLITYYLLARKGIKGKVVRTVATTHLLDKIAKKFNSQLIETPVGFKWIADQMLSSKVAIGGEESGGLSIAGHVPEKDGILACLLCLEIVAVTGRSLSENLRDLKRMFGTYLNRRLDISVTPTKKQLIMDKLTSNPPQQLGEHQVVKLLDIDGIKLVLDNDDWLLARASGTEPVVRVYLEASSADGLSLLEGFAQDITNSES